MRARYKQNLAYSREILSIRDSDYARNLLLSKIVWTKRDKLLNIYFKF